MYEEYRDGDALYNEVLSGNTWETLRKIYLLVTSTTTALPMTTVSDCSTAIITSTVCFTAAARA